MKGYVDLNQNKRQDWVTPPEVRTVVQAFKPIKLDVCTSAHNAMQAEQYYTPTTNGLVQPWACGGLVWCNFPWSRDETPRWVERASEQGSSGAEVLLLGPSRSDTGWFRRLWSSADAVCFWAGRITFLDPDTMEPMRTRTRAGKWVTCPCPVPTLFAYWGPDVEAFTHTFASHGPVQQLRQSAWWSAQCKPRGLEAA